MEKEIKDLQDEKVLQLSSASLKEEHQKLIEDQTEHPIAIGENLYYVKIDNVFRSTKKHKLLDDLVEFFDASNINPELLEIATPYTSLLMIKYFTSIDISDDIDEALEMLDVMIDLDALTNVLNSMPEEQVIDMYELLSVTIDRMKSNMEEAGDEAERLSVVVKNKELSEMLKDGRFKQPE